MSIWMRLNVKPANKKQVRWWLMGSETSADTFYTTLRHVNWFPPVHRFTCSRVCVSEDSNTSHHITSHEATLKHWNKVNRNTMRGSKRTKNLIKVKFWFLWSTAAPSSLVVQKHWVSSRALMRADGREMGFLKELAGGRLVSFRCPRSEAAAEGGKRIAVMSHCTGRS